LQAKSDIAAVQDCKRKATSQRCKIASEKRHRSGARLQAKSDIAAVV